MDCAAEEQLVRMSLDDIAGIDSTHIDLDERIVTVTHRIETSVIKEALDGLRLGTTPLGEGSEAGFEGTAKSESEERRALTVALAINAVFFVAEMIAGILGRSMGLVADSLDMLADASVYALSLVAVGGSAPSHQLLWSCSKI